MTTREKIEELENRLDVASLEVDALGRKFQIYPWLKGRLFYKMITGHEPNQKRGIKLYWQQITSLFYGCHNFFRRYDIWSFSTSLERREIDGKYFDKLFDYIGNDLGYKMLLIELRVYSYFPYRKIASKYAVSRSVFMLFEELYGRLFLRKTKINDGDLLKEILDLVPEGIEDKWIIRKYLSQYRMMKFWLKILPNPKVVLLSVSYTNFGYIRAFKEKGIKVIEIQHGVITKNHHGYFYAKGFDPIQFPDYLLTIGEKELQVFDQENHFPVKQVLPLGSYIIDRYNESYQPHDSKGKPTVLFTLQDGQMADRLIGFILELKAKHGDELDMIIQPRRKSKEFYLKSYPELVDIEFSKKHFYAAVLDADIHCTVYSTTAIEALSLGVPNILVNVDNQSVEQLGTVLQDNPYTTIVDTPEQFLEGVPSLLEAKRDLVQKSNEMNIKLNFRKNVKDFLEQVMA